MQCKAAVVRGPGDDFIVETVDIAEPRTDEVLVRIAGVGLCHSDLHMRDRAPPPPFPWILGHEGAGTVEAVGEAVTDLVVGDKVVISFNSCGTCAGCRTDHPAYCSDFMLLNGSGRRRDGSPAIRSLDGAPIGSHFFGQSSFAELSLAHRRNVVKVPADAPLEILGPLGCGLQTGAGAAMRELACAPGSSILILGAGTVGMACIMGAAIQGCTTIIVSEPFANRREMALELGATHVIDPAAQDLVAAVAAIAPDGVNYAFDTTGNPQVIHGGILSLGIKGTIALAGIEADPLAHVPVTGDELRRRGISIRGGSEGDSDIASFIPQLLGLWREGRFPIEKLVSRYPLSDINRAVSDQLAGKCLKPVLIP